MLRRLAIGLALVLALASPHACLPGGGPPLLDREDAGPPKGLDLDEGGLTRQDVDLGDPFAIDGLVPSHGPFTGGTRANLTGRGFSTKIRVWFGDTEVPRESVFASDPLHVAVQAPPGKPGPVDVRIRDDVTLKERVLRGAFSYDAFVMNPDSGATSGGTRVAVVGSGTAWGPGTTVQIGGKDCVDVVVEQPTRVLCTTPASSPGTRDVTVTAGGLPPLQVRDAFTYSDSPDGYRGGLSGGVLAGRIRVLARDGFTGQPLGGARVILGGTWPAALTKLTSPTGVAEFTDPALDRPITVTVGAKCHQPITFVDVPVDTATVYLSPTLDPSCADGDPPSVGGSGGIYGGLITGELFFNDGVEFKRGNWTRVPNPTRPTERLAAYVFAASSNPAEPFVLPDVSDAITPSSPGLTGYRYSLVTFPGNVTLYAIAGIEDRSLVPPRLTPYLMGVVRGVSVPPNSHITGVQIPMTSIVDHALVLSASPPPIGPRGPDRFVGQVAVSLGANAFAILPNGRKTSPLPLSSDLSFVGVPSLAEGLVGESYVLSASAATGATFGRPASLVSRIRTRVANDPVAVGGFLPVPVLSQPGAGVWAGNRVSFTGAPTADLSLVQISSGLVSWLIVAPGGKTTFDVPNLSLVPGDPIGLTPGGILTNVYVARIDAFSYGKVRYGQLQPGSWSAQAVDSLAGVF